jgi:drug/metabolite transporter (DMT)-like permease
MNSVNWLKMTVLAAIWGSSFIFMKILAPVIGVVPTACLRILISGSALCLGMKAVGLQLGLKSDFKHFMVIGVINAALPFFLYSFAATHAPSSLSVMMNSTTPIFGALFSLFWLGERLTLGKGLGFLLGTAGVALIALRSSHGGAAGSATPSQDSMIALAAFAGLIAAACYALAGVYIKKFASHIKPFALTGMSHLIGGFILLPFTLQTWAENPMNADLLTSKILVALLFLSLLCSASAFLIFYHLVNQIGPTQTMAVGYLIPAFGILWGSLFLGEPITPEMVLGTALILMAVAAISMKPKRTEAGSSFIPANPEELERIIQAEIAVESARKGQKPA